MPGRPDVPRSRKCRFTLDFADETPTHLKLARLGGRVAASNLRRRARSAISRYTWTTWTMEKAGHTLTLVVEEDLLLAARKIAYDRRTSVDQMLREYLLAL